MKKEKDYRKEWVNLQECSFKEIELVLRNYDYDSQNMLASFVASICDVDVADMLSASDNAYVSQVRWLYWYALRYMTQDSYQRISERTMLGGCKFTKDGIRKGCEKMNVLIETDDAWLKRWIVIKRMIKFKREPLSYQESDNANPMPKKYKVMVTMPDELKDKIDVVFKEKRGGDL